MKKIMVFKELQKGKIICLTLIVFIALASALFASAINLMYSLHHSLNIFNENAKPPHFLQMHIGDFNPDDIQNFAKSNQNIEKYQIVKLLNIPAEALYINKEGSSESGSIIDSALVVQNEYFDLLLDSQNQIASVQDGQVMLPIYYKIKYELKKGDVFKLWLGDEFIEFEIADFIKDAQMNSSFVSSKRILVSQNDWNRVASKFGDLEYIIEFLTRDINKIEALESAYLVGKLPANGATITFSEIRLLNALTDMLSAVLLLVIVGFLVGISVLCVRFSMISSIEQDYMDIAVMRGLGISDKYLESIYLNKYALISIIGCVIGYLTSFKINAILNKNIELYMGIADKGIWDYLIQILAVLLIGVCIILLCRKSIGKIKSIGIVDMLQDNNEISSDKMVGLPSLSGRGQNWANFKLGIKYLLSYKKPSIAFVLIFISLSFLVLLPVQITSTLKSKQFTQYMGVVSSDLRIDFQQGVVSESELLEKLAQYEGISEYQLFDSYLAEVQNNKSETVTVNFETGNYSIFGLDCVIGTLPQNEGEVAISYLLADSVKAQLGDEIHFKIASKQYHYKVCGIYQDLTNGGKSAKSISKIEGVRANRNILALNTISKDEKTRIKDRLNVEFQDGKATDIADYVKQSMGDIISKFDLIVIMTILIAILVIILVIGAFMRILIIRYKSDIAIMKALGYKNADIRMQYSVRLTVPTLFGVFLGSVLVLVVGQYLVSAFMKTLGAPNVVFISNPFVIYILFPSFVLAIAITVINIASHMLNNVSIIKKI